MDSPLAKIPQFDCSALSAAQASVRLSGLKVTGHPSLPSRPVEIAVLLPVARSQSLISPEPPTAARVLPSGLKTRWSAWQAKVCRNLSSRAYRERSQPVLRETTGIATSQTSPLSGNGFWDGHTLIAAFRSIPATPTPLAIVRPNPHSEGPQGPSMPCQRLSGNQAPNLPEAMACRQQSSVVKVVAIEATEVKELR